MSRVIGVIPARKGSKGIPRKCVYPLAGKPLIAHTIEAALASTLLNDTIVTTDCPVVKKVAKGYNLKVLNRPRKYALDSSGSDEVVTHAIDALSMKGDDIIVFLQPTSPLRMASDIDFCIKKIKDDDSALGVYSVCQPTIKPMKAFTKNGNGYLKGLYGKKFPFMRRQELQDCYYSNGAIYVFYVNAFRSSGHSFAIDRILPYVMTDDCSVDIDDFNDIKNAEKIIEKKICLSSKY